MPILIKKRKFQIHDLTSTLRHEGKKRANSTQCKQEKGAESKSRNNWNRKQINIEKSVKPKADSLRSLKLINLQALIRNKIEKTHTNIIWEVT